MKATAVIVTYNSARTLPAALESLQRCQEAGVADTIVVDNASNDETWEIVGRHSGWLSGVRNKGNIGFGRGCNVGLRASATPYVVFVNPDAQLEPGVCSAMLRFMEEHPGAGMVAPSLVEEDGGVQHFGGLASPRTILRSAWRGGSAGRAGGAPGISEPFETDWVCGALFMSPTQFLAGIGGFDERFFLYYEETDLCRRVRAAGRSIWAMPGLVAQHVGGASSKRSTVRRVNGCIAEHLYRSRFYYLRKHFGLAAAVGTECAELALLGARAGARLVRGKPLGDIGTRFRSPICRQPAKVAEAT